MYNVAVLLTTYNSSNFIIEQINSILSQKSVSVHIYISDDHSTDNTLDLIECFCPKDKYTFLINDVKFGKPGINFFNLIERVNSDLYDFFCFSDHDDIWQPVKLREGISLMINTNSFGYSSSFHLYYPEKNIIKFVSKHPFQKRYDFLFSSPGPGCTFVLNRLGYFFLRNLFLKNKSLFLDCEYHDWAIYACFRSMDIPWIIDDRSFILYRQHESNDTGANSGLKAYYKRFIMFFNHKYEFQIKNIVLLIFSLNRTLIENIFKLNKFKYFKIIYLHSRRNFRDRLILLFISLFGFVRKKKIFHDLDI